MILKLKIAEEIANQKGISFAKSKRQDHFKPKKEREDIPSPTSYYSEILPSYAKTSTIKPLTACGFRTSKTVMKISS